MTTLFGDTAISTAAPIDAPLPRKKRGWLPLLTILFCFSYGLMTMLIVEQGSTIESQRALILELFRDSTELTATKMKALKDKRAAAPATKARNQSPSTQDPSTQDPSTQDHSNQTPSSQAVPATWQAESSAKKRSRSSRCRPRPAADLADDRRALITI